MVPTGAPLVDIGNPLDLEVAADRLSTDAVQIKVGTPVRIDGRGGQSIRGKVVRIDPAGFLKVSARGIEEQRVRATIDFADPPEARSELGREYRVIVHVTVWNGENVLMMPRAGRYFQSGMAGCGLRSSKSVAATAARSKILGGMGEGDQVVLHLSDRVKNGTPVSQRRGRYAG